MTEPVVLPVAAAVPALRSLAVRLATPGPGVVLMSEGLVVAPAALAPLTHDPRVATSLLVRPGRESADVRVRHHLVTSVGTGFHSVTAADHRSVGALVVSAGDRERAASCIADLVSAIDSGEVVTDGSDLVELVALCLVRGEVSVRAIGMVDVPWFRSPADPGDAWSRVHSVSDDRIAALQANRIDDGLYSTFVVRRLSKPVTRLALRLGWSPNAITLISLVIGVAAAGAFAWGSRWALVAGAVLLQCSLVVDCVDGEVARATRRFSAVGAWLDASTDRVKEFLAYAGLAAGAAREGFADLWWLALVLVVVQTTRHMSDYDFSRVQRLREAHVVRRDVRVPDDGAADLVRGWSVSGAMELSSRMNGRDVVRWIKRAIHLPIGERWLIISVLAALAGAAWALGTLLAAGLLALAYVSAGRALRTLTWRGPTPEPGVLLLRRQADSGPALSALAALVPARLRDRWWAARPGWAIPALLRLGELGTVAAVAVWWHPVAVVAAFWWAAVVAFHHYDTLYRALQGASTPRWLVWSGLGWEGRTVLVLALAVAGAGALTVGLTWGAVVLALLFLVIASVQWLSVQDRVRT